MIVHRFMSEDEYGKLISGERMRNTSTHLGHRTTSVGFCFFSEDPREAIHWLSGCVDCDVCVTMEFPDGYLRKSEGYYRDVERDKDFSGKYPPVKRKEYCCTEYSVSECRIIEADKESFSGYSWMTRLYRFMRDLANADKIDIIGNNK